MRCLAVPQRLSSGSRGVFRQGGCGSCGRSVGEQAQYPCVREVRTLSPALTRSHAAGPHYPVSVGSASRQRPPRSSRLRPPRPPEWLAGAFGSPGYGGRPPRSRRGAVLSCAQLWIWHDFTIPRAVPGTPTHCSRLRSRAFRRPRNFPRSRKRKRFSPR
jgi:hypothetical protein